MTMPPTLFSRRQLLASAATGTAALALPGTAGASVASMPGLRQGRPGLPEQPAQP
jgi:hypothetical protein